MQRRTRIGRLIVLAVFVVICSSVGAGADLVIDGLDAEGVNETFTEDTVRFQTSYMNQSLDPQQVFVPDQLVDNLDAFTYSLQSFDEGQWPGVAAQLFLQVQYATHWSTDYPSENLSVVLGNDDTVDTSLTPHQFVFSDSTTANRTGGVENVFDTRIADGPTTVNISVDAHYEHLLITYTVRQKDTVVWNTTDVYSGEEPDRVAFTADAEQVNETTTRQNTTLDNAHDTLDHKVIGFVYDSDAEIQAIDWNGLEHTPISVTYDGFVKPAVMDAGLSEAVVLDDVLGMQTAYYNVTVPTDSTPTITATFRHPDTTRDTGNRLQVSEAGPFYTYIVGSGGALKVTSSQELCGDVTNSTGGLYDTVTIDATATVCQKNGSSWTGQVNLTANDWVNVTSNGKIDGDGQGYAGGSGGDAGSSSDDPGSSGSGTGGGGGGQAQDGSGIHDAAGGGGAGFGGSGGGGGDADSNTNGGSGGSSYSNESERKCFLGSGGGGGGAVNDGDSHGGNGGRGGGCIYISAYTTMVHGELTVDGDNGGSGSCGCDDTDAAGGGGGGAGGTVWLQAYTLNVSSATLTATGGRGGSGATFNENAGGGGGGAGGRIKLFYEDTLDNSTNTYSTSAGGGGSGDGGSNGAGGNTGSQYWELLDMGFNFIPELLDALVQLFSGGSDDRVNANLSINEDGEQDIRSYSPDPPHGNEKTFNNQTLLIGDTSTLFNWTVTVTDFESAVSNPRDVNFTVTVPHVYGENTTGPVNETHQTVNSTARITNHGNDAFDFKAGFTPPSGLIAIKTANNQTVENIGGAATIRTDWWVDHIHHQKTYSEENTSTVSNVTHQYVDRPKQFENDWATTYTRANITESDSFVSGTCTNCFAL